jgi:hypothetical protein
MFNFGFVFESYVIAIRRLAEKQPRTMRSRQCICDNILATRLLRRYAPRNDNGFLSKKGALLSQTTFKYKNF